MTECLPALVPMECKEPWAAELQGLSLRNVRARILDGKKVLYEEFGEMLFTHYGKKFCMKSSGKCYLPITGSAGH